MQRSVWVRTFSSPACVHAIESSDDDGSRRSAMAPSVDEESRKKINRKVTRLLLPLKHRRRVVSRALRSLSWGATKTKEEEPNNNNKDGGQTSDAETTFVSAHSSELRSSSTDADDDSSEPPSSFRLSPPPIFPLGSIERRPPASPVKIMCKLPFGYVVGRQLDAVPAPPPPPSMTTLARKIKKVVPAMAALHLRSRSQMVRKKVGRALNEACRQGRREGAEEVNGGNDDVVDDEDVFWKKDVKGLRCRVEDDDDPY